MPAEALLEHALHFGISENSHAMPDDLLAGLKYACKIANGGPLVIAGSLYLVSDVLRLQRQASTV